MTFVTKGSDGRNIVQITGIREAARCPKDQIRSAESISASKAFELEIVTVRPSILSIPSAWRRERLRETSSLTVPMCEANS